MSDQDLLAGFFDNVEDEEPEEFEPPADRQVSFDRWGRYSNLPPVPDFGPGPWTRVSDIDQISDETLLHMYEKRQVVRGLESDPELFKPMRGSRFNAETSHGKRVINKIAEAAQDAAGSHKGSSLGTRFHDLAERLDRGEDPKQFDSTPELTIMLKAYWSLRREYKVQALPGYLERTVFVPELQACGTFDSLNSDNGVIRIGDTKTQGTLDFSHISIPIQLAAYAHASLVLNRETWEWEEMPEVDQEKALIFWVPASEPGRAELHEANLIKGWADALESVRIMERRMDHTTITQRHW